MKPKIRRLCKECGKVRRHNQRDECIYCNTTKKVGEKITQRCTDRKWKSEEICGGELKPKIDFFERRGKCSWKQMQKDFKKQFGKDKNFRPLREPKGYNCILCGACYSKDFKREEYNIGWLRNEN